MAGALRFWACKEWNPARMRINKMMIRLFMIVWVKYILPIHLMLVLFAQCFWNLCHFYSQIVDLIDHRCESRFAVFRPELLPAVRLRFLQRFGIPRLYHLVIS